MKIRTAILSLKYPADMRSDDFLDALDMGADALEKQLPKKVCLTFGNYYCHNCHSRISRKNTKLFRYCPECGQALDWSDNDVEIH